MAGTTQFKGDVNLIGGNYLVDGVPVTGGNPVNGWAIYTDSQYTSGSPFTIPEGTRVALPNNAAGVIDNEKPSEITTFYDGSRVQFPHYGDFGTVDIDIVAWSSSNDGQFRIGIDMSAAGDASDIFAATTITTGKAGGAGNASPYEVSFNIASRLNAVANGGLILIEALRGNCNVYNIEYLISRLFRGTGLSP